MDRVSEGARAGDGVRLDNHRGRILMADGTGDQTMHPVPSAVFFNYQAQAIMWCAVSELQFTPPLHLRCRLRSIQKIAERKRRLSDKAK